MPNVLPIWPFCSGIFCNLCSPDLKYHDVRLQKNASVSRGITSPGLRPWSDPTGGLPSPDPLTCPFVTNNIPTLFFSKILDQSLASNFVYVGRWRHGSVISWRQLRASSAASRARSRAQSNWTSSDTPIWCYDVIIHNDIISTSSVHPMLDVVIAIPSLIRLMLLFCFN